VDGVYNRKEKKLQTFLPYPDFNETAKVLHPRWHLGNQFYREGLTILRGGWKNHPASKMWQGSKTYLCEYLVALHIQLNKIGRNYPKTFDEIIAILCKLPASEDKKPPWLGDPAFHAAHRSNLLRKDTEKGWNWYHQFGWTEPEDLPYIWPKP
jgi:hypothetical protein